MAHLSHEEKMQYTSVFLQLDEELGNGEGALDIKAFEKYLFMCGYRISKERVAEVFCRADIDGNWKITLDEFLARLPHLAPQGSPEARAAVIRRRFENSDLNHDGFLTFDELTVLMGGIQDDQEALKELVKCILDKWDEDGDGKINFEEFLTLYLESDLEEDDFSDVDAFAAEGGEEGEANTGGGDERGEEEHAELKQDPEEPTEEDPEKPKDVSTAEEEEPEKSKDVSTSKNVKDKQEEKKSCGGERKDAERKGKVGGAVSVKDMAARLEKMSG
ncbi:calmodulin-like protein 5 [Haliotis rufescens]|uniref:calmodulin-like protein 5 n=1 Tax=Haliotis rufescens TaxID=6454 RepID=UPI00201F9D3D|nr:calmodulin-like protein 5 [Haliotis rufescens]